MTKYVFCLGGLDQEMEEIKRVATEAGHVVLDKGLGWGAKISDYTEEIWEHVESRNLCAYKFGGGHPRSHEMEMAERASAKMVFVELEIDEAIIPDSSRLIDHHGKEAGRPPALQQILDLLEITPSKKQDMIGAMDAGYIYGLIALGCTEAEIAEFLGQETGLSVKQMLVNSCGLTDDQAAEADRDIAAATIMPDGLIVVHRDRNTCAEICALLYGFQQDQDILILSDWTDNEGKQKQEVNFYSTGSRVKAVAAEFPQGWTGGAGLMPPTEESTAFWTKYGGSAPDTAFFGACGNNAAIERFIRNLR